MPPLHPELAFPNDVRTWSGDQCLRYLTSYGSNQSGNLIVGDTAFAKYLATTAHPVDAIEVSKRKTVYPKMAENILSATPAGSSAAGEQPKFLATLVPQPLPVLVKFSPSAKDSVAQRTADLLICEHLAHLTLIDVGMPAAHSELLFAAGRVFLQMARFDRSPGGGRQGCISLAPLNTEFLGGDDTWEAIAQGLRAQRKISETALRSIVWLDVFGALIANNDRHPGNMALRMRGTRLGEPTPVYDMLPMHYAPRGGELPDVAFEVPMPKPAWAAHWGSACAAAASYWETVAGYGKVSREFRETAARNATMVRGAAALADRLPR